METNVRAFFYEYKYYLFPADCYDLRELKNRSFVTATRLKEVRCMAPDFIYESMEEEELEITAPEHLFEVFVNLYSGKEYDEILSKQIDRVCPGCERFIENDDPSLEGHHREISLSGLCYEREGKDDPWDFSRCVDVFWYRISRKLNELAKCIDQGDQKKLNEICGEELKHIFYPVRFWGGIKDGKYCLGFAPDCHLSSAARTIITYMAFAAMQDDSEMKTAGWEVFPCRVKGVFPYTGKTKFKKGVARLSACPNPNALAVELYSKHPDKESPETTLCSDFYDYLCAELGEEVVAATLMYYDFTAEKEGMTTIEDIVCSLADKFKETTGEENKCYPTQVMYSTSFDGSVHHLPFRDKIVRGATICTDLSFLERDHFEESWWLDFISFCYLYIPSSTEEALETIMWYVANSKLIPEPYRNPDDERVTGASLGFCECDEGFIMDNCVASEQKFYRTLRALAPVMMAYNVKLTVVNKQGIMTYSCGYTFEPLDE